MILLVLIMAATTWASPPVNRVQGHKSEEDPVVRTIVNVTRMVNVTDHQLQEDPIEIDTANFTMDGDSVENFQCATFRWGKDCSLVCDCNNDGALECHRYSGQCICNSCWYGEKCENYGNSWMYVVVFVPAISILLFIGIIILMRTLERKIMENKKARSMAKVSSSRRKNQDAQSFILLDIYTRNKCRGADIYLQSLND